MNKIINGARYDTEKATKIGSIRPMGQDTGNFSYFCETLYRTKSGKYFLHGEGHGNSKYGVWRGNTGGWGEAIRPYTLEDAKEWGEANLSADEYEAEFGEVVDDPGERVPLSLTVAADIKAALEKQRNKTGISMSQIVEAILRERL